MRSYSRQAWAALLGACFLFCLTLAPASAAGRGEYLNKGTEIQGLSDSGRKDLSPLEDLNWLRSKAATEEIKRRKLETELRGVSGELEDARAEKLRLENRVYDLEEQVTELESRPAAAIVSSAAADGQAAVPAVGYAIAQGYYEVREGDSLWKIAASEDVFSDARKWSELFYANKDKITDPNLIYPGQVLEIPEYYIVPELTVTEVAGSEKQAVN